MEIPAADFYEKLQFGKIMFVYFEHQGKPFYMGCWKCQKVKKIVKEEGTFWK